MGVDGNLLRNAGGTIIFSAFLLLGVGVLAVCFASLRGILRRLALLIIKVALPTLFFFSMLWFSFISSNPNKRPLFWSSLAGIFYFLFLQVA
jgi:hypothetical protein